MSTAEDRSGGVRERYYDALDVARRPRTVRAGLRYAVGWGGLLANGVTFAAVVSLSAALTILVNAARAFLAGRPALFEAVIDRVNAIIPDIIDDGSNDGLIPPESMAIGTGTTITTVVSAVVVLWTALTVMTGMRRAIRHMFGLGGAPLRFVRGKAIDLMGFVLLGASILLSSALVSGVTFLGQAVMDWLGLAGGLSRVLLGIGAVLLAGVLDALLVLLLFRVIAKVRIPRDDLRWGLLLGAVGLGLLRLGGTSLIGLSDNPVLASLAAGGTVLLWINLAVRWLLLVAAWTANPPAAHVPVHPSTVHAREVPNYVTLSAPHTLSWPHHQVTGALLPGPDPRFHRDGGELAGRDGPPSPRVEEPGPEEKTVTTLTPRVHDDGRSRLVAYDFGAHLASWDQDGRPVVWLGPHAVLDGSRPIRGGVPICFPWFDAGPAGDLSPSHGPVRRRPWRPTQAEGDEVWAWEITAADVAADPGAEHLPGDFRARYAVSLHPGEGSSPVLGLRLEVTNPTATAYPVEVALHTYLAVGDVGATRVLGLEGVSYLDKETGERSVQEGAVRFTGPTDRVYDSPGRGLLAVDDRGRAHLHLNPEGATQTVVWNPWEEQAAQLPDLGDQDWRRFVCVETAATGDRALEVPPGGSVALGCEISVLPYPAA